MLRRSMTFTVISLGMLFWLGLVLALTMLPGRGGLMRQIALFFGQSDLHGAIGHMALMASLVFVLFIGLVRIIPYKYALLLSVTAVFVIGTSTEIYQSGVYGRASTLTDLLANWVGAFSVGYMLSLWQKPRKKELYSR
ncbi:MAG: hypothetical protein Phog2KO_46320 [Phototrophicaceae bacterium]